MKRPTPELAGPAARYAAGVTTAHIITVTEVVFVVIALAHQSTAATHRMVEGRDTGLMAAVAIPSIIAVAIGSVYNILPTLRWFTAGREPTARQRRAALGLPRRQSYLLTAVWALIAIVVVAAHPEAALPTGLLIVPAAFFGATAATLTAMLLTVRTLRPIIAATASDGSARDTTPGVMARLLGVWVLISALPSVGIALLFVARANGWVLDRSASLEVPVLVLLAVAVASGLRAMILVSQSISNPVREVIDAMADVERGNLEHTVAVYEHSEIGRLQTGFNRMVIGLRERDRLRDLFGRNVGGDVVQLLVDQDESVYGVERDVAVMFIDLAGSTQLAANLPPHAVARLLNSFFQSVVLAVDKHGGFVNKFQGDAALAVFGAPLDSATAASDALATARDLATEMHRGSSLDFGIGVTAGAVFAGFVGAENRFEYTVIGDAVNESSRLADRAKQEPGRLLCSAAALAGAEPDEQNRWVSTGSEVLRGRNMPTEMFAPTGRD